VVYSVLEHWSLVDSLYFSVVTLATVGFGDLHPTTDASKLFTVGYIIAGIGIIAAFASELAKHRIPPDAADAADAADAWDRPIPPLSSSAATGSTSRQP
jgi:hypothetical protein